MTLPELTVGDKITYQINTSTRTRVTRTGVVVDQTDRLVVIDNGRYRDSFLIQDLITGDVKILGGEYMARGNRIEAPSREYLAELYEKYERNIHQTAKNCVPAVSATTMRKWLKDAGIIPTQRTEEENQDKSKEGLKADINGEREEPVAASPAEKDLAEAFRLIGDLADSQRLVAERLIKVEEGLHSPEAIKKMVEFIVSPIQERLDRLTSLFAPEQPTMPCSSMPEQQNEILELLADLAIRIMRKMQTRSA